MDMEEPLDMEMEEPLDISTMVRLQKHTSLMSNRNRTIKIARWAFGPNYEACCLIYICAYRLIAGVAGAAAAKRVVAVHTIAVGKCFILRKGMANPVRPLPIMHLATISLAKSIAMFLHGRAGDLAASTADRARCTIHAPSSRNQRTEE